MQLHVYNRFNRKLGEIGEGRKADGRTKWNINMEAKSQAEPRGLQRGV